MIAGEVAARLLQVCGTAVMPIPEKEARVSL